MNKFIKVLVIALSMVLGFTACKSDDGGTILTNEQLLKGQWWLKKTVSYDAAGNVSKEVVEEYNECTQNNLLYVQDKARLIIFKNQYINGECSKTFVEGNWEEANNIFYIYPKTGFGEEFLAEEFAIKTLNKTEMILEIPRNLPDVSKQVYYYQRLK